MEKILSEDDYLTPEERRARAAAKREELKRARLTPDWFQGQRELCLPSTLRVAVIGGGFAGLAAAWYLDACGAATTVYEARSQVGGRVETDSSFVGGKVVEVGAELIGENHPLWWELAARFRLRLDELTDDEAYEAARLTVRLRFGTHDLTRDEKKRLKANLKRPLIAIGREARPIDQREPWLPPATPDLDNKTVAARLDELLGRASSFERSWFEFTLGNDNCAPVTAQSYLGLLGAVSAARMGSDDKGMLGYWMSTETHRCAGGNQQLGRALARPLPDVRVDTAVTDVQVGQVAATVPGALVRQVTITSQTATPPGVTTRHDEFDFAILAVPPAVWKGIKFSPPFNQARRGIQHGPAVKYLSRYKMKFWEAPGVRLAPSAKWDRLGSVWEGTDRQPPVPEYDLSVFSGGQFVLPASEYPRRLAALYPTGAPSGTLFADWPSRAFIMTGYGVPAPGEVMGVGRVQPTPHYDRLYFAGEQTSMGFFGYMEGALQSGARAARDIVVRVARPCAETD